MPLPDPMAADNAYKQCLQTMAALKCQIQGQVQVFSGTVYE